MKITRDEVEHIASLARLDMAAEEVEEMAGHMNDILIYMDKLSEVDTEGIEPTTHAIGDVNAFREDEVKPWLSQAEALAGAPEEDGEAFIVPKVI